jgi:hypothetical protein
MKTDVSYYDFREAFANHDRIDQFTPAGLEMLYTFLIDFEADTGEEMTLDVIAFCCEFTEEPIEDIPAMYDYPADDWQTYLEDNTMVVGYTDADTVIYQSF